MDELVLTLVVDRVDTRDLLKESVEVGMRRGIVRHLKLNLIH